MFRAWTVPLKLNYYKKDRRAKSGAMSTPTLELTDPNGDFLFIGWSGDTGPSAGTPLPRTERTRPGLSEIQNARNGTNEERQCGQSMQGAIRWIA